MPRFLIDHMEGCMPGKPCVSCQDLALLKTKLKPNDFEEFVRVLNEAAGMVPHIAEKPTVDQSRPWAEVFNFSVRLANALKNEGVETVADILKMTSIEIIRLPNVGGQSLRELELNLAQYGLRLTEGVK